jgi:hypothetical protein
MERVLDSHWVWAVIIGCNCKEAPINPIFESRTRYYVTQTPTRDSTQSESEKLHPLLVTVSVSISLTLLSSWLLKNFWDCCHNDNRNQIPAWDWILLCRWLYKEAVSINFIHRRESVFTEFSSENSSIPVDLKLGLDQICYFFLYLSFTIELLYRVFQEERSVFWEVIVSVMLAKKLYMYMCPIPNCFRDRVFHCTVPKLFIRERYYALFLIPVLIIQVTKLVQFTKCNTFSKIPPLTSMHFATRVRAWRVAPLCSAKCTVQWNSSISETVRNMTHVHTHIFT